MAERDRGDNEPDDARMYTSEPLEAEDGSEYVIRQQNVGPGNELGGGEWPDPDTPAQSPAPGAAGAAPTDAEASGTSTRTEAPRATASLRLRPRRAPK